MYVRRTYPMDQKRPPQKAPEKPKETLCSVGLCIGLFIGFTAISFLIYTYQIPNNFFPHWKDPFRNLKPLIKQGNLVMYPLQLDMNNYNTELNSSYVIILPSKNVSQELQRILDGYPSHQQEGHYTQCWLDHPTYDKPCFFSKTWLNENCSQANNFGYTEQNGVYNPCVFFRVERTHNWKPVPDTKEDLPQRTSEFYDPSFSQLYCYPKFPSNESSLTDIIFAPEKGIPSTFFPAANFSPAYYLQPIVSVQFIGIKKGFNTSIECAILAQNSYILHNDGQIVIEFVALS